MTGRNDLTVDGKKISGMSALKIGNRFLCGGTLMVDVDLAAAAKALTPPKAKLQSKGIKSVHSRVTNIRQYFEPKYKNMTFEELEKRILLTVFRVTDIRDVPTYKMTDEDWKEVLQIADDTYTGDDFVMGTKPNDDYFRGRHFDGVGTVEVSFSVKNDVISHAKIYGDFNNPNVICRQLKRILPMCHLPKPVWKKLFGPVTLPITSATFHLKTWQISC